MNEKRQRKKRILIVISIILLVCLVTGFTYAWLSQTIIGTKNLTITVGELALNLDESTSNGIQLKYAIPTEDEMGRALEPYTFTVTNNGGVAANYSLSLRTDEKELANCQVEEMVSCEQLDLNNIRYELKENGISTIRTLGTNGKLLDSYIGQGETNTYELRIWLNIDTGNDAQGKVFYGQLKLEAKQTEKLKTVAETLLAGVGENGDINTSDPEQTFITGTEPNNYIWYSGKLWRAVSIDPSDNSVKLVTQWNISTIPYNSANNTAFEGSYMESWLNDTSGDGFLGNLREPEKFIKMDSVWNATETTETSKPEKTTMVTDPIGLLNIYEYTMSYSGTTSRDGYLNNGLYWWILTSYSTSNMQYVNYGGGTSNSSPSNSRGIRPSVNLKSSVKIINGDGTENNPYRLAGDNDSELSGTLLNTRYSGEYITFGTGENTLYRIVSHETSGLTKTTSAEPLKSNGSFITSAFGNSDSEVNYSSSSPIGTFLNGEYLTSYVGSTYRNMIEENTVWYLGMVGEGENYRLAKYSNTTGNDLTSNTITAQVGLLRLGELMSGQFDRFVNNTIYWILTTYNVSSVRGVNGYDYAYYYVPSSANSIRPSFNLKQNVIITGGSGTKEAPFTLSGN